MPSRALQHWGVTAPTTASPWEQSLVAKFSRECQWVCPHFCGALTAGPPELPFQSSVSPAGLTCVPQGQALTRTARLRPLYSTFLSTPPGLQGLNIPKEPAGAQVPGEWSLGLPYRVCKASLRLWEACGSVSARRTRPPGAGLGVLSILVEPALFSGR